MMTNHTEQQGLAAKRDTLGVCQCKPCTCRNCGC